MNATQHAHTTWPRQLAAPGRGWLRFALHVVEMQVAMTVGMGVGSLLDIGKVPDPTTEALLWLVAMTVPMVAWMRLRGMSWRSGAEMAGAMSLPALAGIAAFAIGALGPAALICLEHSAMTPAMVALMAYRRHDYGWD